MHIIFTFARAFPTRNKLWSCFCSEGVCRQQSIATCDLQCGDFEKDYGVRDICIITGNYFKAFEAGVPNNSTEKC